MSEVGLKDLLQAGVHFGHQTHRWNPKMRPYIYARRNLIHIIDVRETIRHWSEGKVFVRELGRAPGDVASVVVIFDEEEDAYPYCQTWLGGKSLSISIG